MPTAEDVLQKTPDPLPTQPDNPEPSVADNSSEDRSGNAAALPEVTHETEIAATYEALMGKRRRREQLNVRIVDEDGVVTKLQVKAEGLGGNAFDLLVEKHPATKDQAATGALYNGKTFIPALLAACVIQPALTVEQWKEIQANPEWSSGEIGHIFNTCWRLCVGGLDVGFTATG